MILKRKKLLSVEECRKLAPLPPELKLRNERYISELKENFVSRKRFVVVCGPCSADSYAPMAEYLEKLKAVADECPDLLVVARIYTTKPHSNGQGYQGSCFAESVDEPIDINKGIIRCRQMMIKCLETGLPVADEILYPDLSAYFDDLTAYRFVGARSCEDSLHRSVASSLDMCCGVKNSIDGDIERLVDSLYAVSHPCVYPYMGEQIETDGCRYAHVVLRGGKNDKGYTFNLSSQDVDKTCDLLNKQGLPDFIMADLSHANSCKIAANQLANAEVAIANAKIGGVMVESYLYGGMSLTQYGASKTDECLSIENTELLLNYLQREYEKRKNNK